MRDEAKPPQCEFASAPTDLPAATPVDIEVSLDFARDPTVVVYNDGDNDITELSVFCNPLGNRRGGEQVVSTGLPIAPGESLTISELSVMHSLIVRVTSDAGSSVVIEASGGTL